MPSHTELKILDYKAKDILDLVMNIEDYPKFLPWCIGAKITKIIDENHLEADLAISFKGIFQKYRSKVEVFSKKNGFEIKVVAIEGPFQNLINIWKITSLEDKKSEVEFFIDFEFKSKILSKMATPIFEKATSKMIQAFEKRAQEIC